MKPRKPLTLEPLIERFTKAAKPRVVKAAKRVDRDAFTFSPEVLLSVAADPLHQRVMVKLLECSKRTTPLHRDVLVRQIENAVKAFVLKERAQRGLHIGHECMHLRRVRKKYVVEVLQNGEEVYGIGSFCRKCGLRVERDLFAEAGIV